MLPFNLLENGKTILTVVITALVVGVGAWGLHSWAMKRADARMEAALASQKEVLVGECRKDKQTTEETSRDLQNQMSDLLGQLDRARRVQPNRCVPAVAKRAGGYDGSPQNQELPVGNGIYSDYLLDFAYRAEQVGRQLDSCQGFIRRVWKGRGEI